MRKRRNTAKKTKVYTQRNKIEGKWDYKPNIFIARPITGFGFPSCPRENANEETKRKEKEKKS